MVVVIHQALFLNISLEPDWAQGFQNLEFLTKSLSFLTKSLSFFMKNVLSFGHFKKTTDFWINLLLKMVRNGVPLVFTSVS